MDKISKRSKGYAFVEYTTEEAASAAIKEMNGKVYKQSNQLFFQYPSISESDPSSFDACRSSMAG